MADNILINQGTQTTVATDDVSSVHYPRMKLDIGADGIASPFTGTIGAVTNLAGGTITKVEGGTVGVVSSIAAGTQNTLGTVGVVNSLAAGTQQTLGTVGVVNNLVTGTLASVTTVANLTSGSVLLQSGTLTVMPNIPGGTVGLITRTGNIGTIESGSIVMTTGTVSVLNTVGTVGVVNNLATGTVAVVTSITNLAGGTVQVNPVPVPSILAQGTLGTAGGSFFGTLSAASGAGTKHYVSGVDIVMQSGTADVRVLCGTGIQGTGVLAAGQFAPSGGISKSFSVPFVSGTNSELTYHFVGAGTAFITVNYWKGA